MKGVLGRSLHEVVAMGKADRCEKPLAEEMWLGTGDDLLGVTGRNSNG